MPVPLTTRLAPSPTGLLHLGNAWSFLLAWLAARKTSGNVYLRIDDIDPQRSKKIFEQQIIEDLSWLGLIWDGPIIWQSQRTTHYQNALGILKAKDLIYPCFCTRRELKSLASAPHLSDNSPAYPGACALLERAKSAQWLAEGKQHSMRLRTAESVAFTDLLQGEVCFTKTEYGGDFPLMRADGVFAYQLANVIDDEAMGIRLVLRGRDLLSSTPRQILLIKALDYRQPLYAHIPLLLDSNGERLAKRHKSLSLSHLRQQGVLPEQILAFLGQFAVPGLQTTSISLPELLTEFQLNQLASSDISLPGPMQKSPHWLRH